MNQVIKLLQSSLWCQERLMFMTVRCESWAESKFGQNSRGCGINSGRANPLRFSKSGAQPPTDKKT